MSLGIRWRRFITPLRFKFKHASADRAASSSIIVEINDGEFRGYGEACPRSYVTGETEESVTQFLDQHGKDWANSIHSIESLKEKIEAEEKIINRNPAAFAALEIALLEFFSQRENIPIEGLLKLPLLSDDIQYSAVVGDSGPFKTRAQSLIYHLIGFRDYKVKIGKDLGRDRKRFASLPSNIRLRVDANNLFTDPEKCVNHLRSLGREIWAIEEPVRVGDARGQSHVSEAMGSRIILDESLCLKEQLLAYQNYDDTWIANIRVSKCGGILRSIDLARAAQEQGVDVILGAHVGETSILSRAALTVGQSLNDPALAREGAFGRILVTEDISNPSLRFGFRGVLRSKQWNFASLPGLGLFINPESLF